MAGLPASGICVSDGPGCPASAPSFGSTPDLSPVPLKPQVAPSSMLCPPDGIGERQLPPELPATIETLMAPVPADPTVRPPPNELPPPPPALLPATVRWESTAVPVPNSIPPPNPFAAVPAPPALLPAIVLSAAVNVCVTPAPPELKSIPPPKP